MTAAATRIALVTGANQGVGFQVATELAARGWTALVGARDPDKGHAAAEAHDQLRPRPHETHAMYAVRSNGTTHAFGRQVFAYARDVNKSDNRDIAGFDAALQQRTLALPGWTVFALVCGEINVLRGRHQPRYISPAAEQAIMATDVIINPTHDRLGNAGTLDAKRRLPSRASEDGRQRVYVSCSNWEACGSEKRRAQRPTPALQIVYAAGEPVTAYDELADGAFGFVYRHWQLNL